MKAIQESAKNAMYDVLVKLWPMHRTVNSDDLEKALLICGDYIGDPRFKLHRFRPKTDVYTWWIPERYRVKEAWLNIEGTRVADFSKNCLHLLSYSYPVHFTGKLGDIRNHIWTREKRPDAIPWEFKYYDRSWGFCLPHSELQKFNDDSSVEAFIDAEFTMDDFCLAEFYLPGDTEDDFLFITNICHPMQVNDSLAGLVVGLEMAKFLAAQPKRKHGFRLLIVPETIGTIAWFAHNENEAAKIKYACFCEMVGHDNSFILQHSYQGDTLIDQAFSCVLPSFRRNGQERHDTFRNVVVSDELVSNGPGFGIPTPSLTRWPYDEYHTSDDNPGIVNKENLAETLAVFMGVWDCLEQNYFPRRKFKGTIMLSRYNLWVDWRENWDLNQAIDELMYLLEGNFSLIEIANKLRLPFFTVKEYVDRLAEEGLVQKNEIRMDL